MLKDILQKHNKEIFTDELSEKIQEMANEEIEKSVNERLIILKEKYDEKLEKLEAFIEEKSEAYEAERNEIEMAKVEAIEKYLEDLKAEVFEANKVDYENVAIVKDAIEVHKINKALQEKYQIDSAPEKVEADGEVKKVKGEYNKLFKIAESEYKERIKAQNELTLYKLSEDLETETDKAKLASIAETIDFEDAEDFMVKLGNHKQLIFHNDDVKKDDNEKKVDEGDDDLTKKDNILNEDKKDDDKKVSWKEKFSYLR